MSVSIKKSTQPAVALLFIALFLIVSTVLVFIAGNEAEGRRFLQERIVTPKKESWSNFLLGLGQVGVRVHFKFAGMGMVPRKYQGKEIALQAAIDVICKQNNLKGIWLKDGKGLVLFNRSKDDVVSRMIEKSISHDVLIRRESAWRGRFIKDIRILAVLTKLAHDSDAEVKRLARKALRHHGWRFSLLLNDRSWELLNQEVIDPRNKVRRNVISWVYAIDKVKGKSLLNIASMDTDQYVRRGSRSASLFRQRTNFTVGTDGKKYKIHDLKDAIASSEQYRRSQAMSSLALRKTAKSRTLIRACAKSEFLDIRLTALKIISKFPGSTSDLQYLRTALKDSNGNVRQAAIRLLAAHGERALPLLKSALNDPSYAVRSSVIYALGTIDSSASFTLLKEIFMDADQGLNTFIASQLYTLRHPAARELFKLAIQDTNRHVRLSVARSAGGESAQESAPLFIHSLNDPVRKVRMIAFSLISKYLEPNKALDLLKGAMKNPNPKIRLRAAGSLGNVKGKGVLPLIIRIINSDDPALRAGAIDSLGVVTNESFHPLLSKALDDPDISVRVAAVNAIARKKQAGALQGLGKALGDSEERVRLKAARALGDFDIDTNLLSIARKDASSWVAVGALGALAKIGSAAAFNSVRNALLDERVEIREAAVCLLSEFETVEVFKYIKEGMRDKSHRVRVRAIYALNELGGKESRPLIREAVRGDVRVKAAICRALGSQESKEAFRLLQGLLTDKDPHVRIHAVEALGKFEKELAQPYVVKALADSEDRVVSTAVEVLIKMNTLKSERLLKQSLTSRNIHLRAEATAALKNFEEGQAFLLLGRMMDDPESRVRTAAVKALSQNSERGVMLLLKKALSDRSPIVRAQAVSALEMKDGRIALRAILERKKIELNKDVVRKMNYALKKSFKGFSEERKGLVELDAKK